MEHGFSSHGGRASCPPAAMFFVQKFSSYVVPSPLRRGHRAGLDRDSPGEYNLNTYSHLRYGYLLFIIVIFTECAKDK